MLALLALLVYRKSQWHRAWWPSLLQPGSGRSGSAGQSFGLGPECFREGDTSQGYTVLRAMRAVSNGSIWCFLHMARLKSVTKFGLSEEHFYSRYQRLSLLPTALSLTAAQYTVHFPSTLCSKSCPLYPPILSGQITVISITNLRSPTQFYLQMPMSHSEPPPTPNKLCH